MTNTNCLNFRDYLFATYEVPTFLGKDFSMQAGVYTGRIIVKIYVPGENEFISFSIKSYIELQGLSFSAKSCHYKLAESTARTRSQPTVSSYFKYDMDLFSKIVNSADTPIDLYSNFSRYDLLLCKSKISDVSLDEFLELTKESIKNTFTTIFCDDFKLKDLNDWDIDAILNSDFSESLIKECHRTFTSIKNILVPEPNQVIPSFYLNKDEIESLNKIIQNVTLIKLRGDLSNSLLEKELDTKKIKV